jgi:hypothetical protein
VLLKKVVSWLKRGQKGPFLREICPLKKMTPKYDAASGIIAGQLLTTLQAPTTITTKQTLHTASIVQTK